MFLARMILACALAAPLLAGPVTSPEKRVELLENSLLAPCCWAEAIATHRSDVALAMKAEVARFVAEGKSDQEIFDYYRQRYGARVLVEPQGGQWWLMNLVPLAMVAGGVVVVAFVLKRWLRPIPSS